MEDKKYRPYAEEFKLHALELLKRGEKSAGEIERDLGITPGLLIKWRARYQIIEKSGQETHLMPSTLKAKRSQGRNPPLTARVGCGGGRARNPKKSALHLLKEKRVKYEFIKAHEQQFSLKSMCRVLDVGRSGYYDWHGRSQSQRERTNEALLKEINTIFEQSRKTYGSPRVYAHLHQKGLSCSRNRVA